MNWGLILLILIGVLNIASLVLLSLRHWRKPETERILPMRGSTRKFIRRVIALFTAEILALMLLVSAFSYALTLDHTILLNDGERLARNIKTLRFYENLIKPDPTKPDSFITSVNLAHFISYYRKEGFNPFWTTEIQPALFRQADQTQVPDYYLGLLAAKYDVFLLWGMFPETYSILVQQGIPLSFENAPDAMAPPESRPMSPVLAGLLRFLYPSAKRDTLRLPAHGSSFDGSFRFAIKMLLIPMDNEETREHRRTLLEPLAESQRRFLASDELREKYGLTPEKIEDMKMTPFFQFAALGNEDVDALVAEDPALEENIYIYYGEGSGTSFLKLFWLNDRTMTMVVLASILLFYLLALASFAYVNARQMGLRERLLLRRERDLLRDVAHELKTPLGVTRLLAEKVQLESDPREKDKAAEQLTGKVDAMNAAVMKNLSASRLENTEEPLQREAFSLRDMALALAEDNAVLLEEKGQRLSLQGTQEDIKISADPVRMEEAITNLLSNAVKYAPEGSEITLSLRKAKRSAVFSLRNDCEAIPGKELRSLWEPYMRLQRDKESGVKGTGLGLAIVRNIVTLHGGRYGAKNVPGGVEFWFEIPM